MATFKEYRDEINRIFARYTKRGFVSYYDCRGLGNDMIDLMINATKELGGRHPDYDIDVKLCAFTASEMVSTQKVFAEQK